MADPKPADAVPVEADALSAGISRRSVMGMMTAVAAVPAVALIPTGKAFALPAPRAAWDRATRRLKEVEAEYSKISQAHSAANSSAGPSVHMIKKRRGSPDP